MGAEFYILFSLFWFGFSDKTATRQGAFTQQIMDGGMATLEARPASFHFVTVTKKTMTSSVHTSY